MLAEYTHLHTPTTHRASYQHWESLHCIIATLYIYRFCSTCISKLCTAILISYYISYAIVNFQYMFIGRLRPSDDTKRTAVNVHFCADFTFVDTESYHITESLDFAHTHSNQFISSITRPSKSVHIMRVWLI